MARGAARGAETAGAVIEATIEDPNVFARPWKLAFGVWTRAPKDYENYEFACHEGNRSVELTSVMFKKPTGE